MQGTAILQGVEAVSYNPGNTENRTEAEHRSHTFHEESERMGTSRLSSGEALQVTFRLPPDAPCSFNAPHNALQWSIRFEVKIAGRPEPWRGTAALIVRP